MVVIFESSSLILKSDPHYDMDFMDNSKGRMNERS